MYALRTVRAPRFQRHCINPRVQARAIQQRARPSRPINAIARPLHRIEATNLQRISPKCIRSASPVLQRWYCTAADQGNASGQEPPQSPSETIPEQPAPTAPETITIAEKHPADMSPEEFVAELDKHIVGHHDAKRAVAVAMRNRWRRRQLPKHLAAEIIPRNILMIGPTGVGKTEVARRVAKLVSAPFIKVEATKFTEVGFRGLDVDTIIKDLVEVGISLVRNMEREKLRDKVEAIVDERLLDLILGSKAGAEIHCRESFRQHLRQGHFDEIIVEYDAPVNPDPHSQRILGLQSHDLDDSSGSPFSAVFISPRQTRKRVPMKVKAVRPLMIEEETDKLLPRDEIHRKAIEAVENDGIVFIDEIDKICGPKASWHPDASGEGVQRDLLPIIEGTTIHTRIGNVDTSKILFICSGAFHHCKPSDMLAELQGRLPIRVTLQALTERDLERILTEPEHSILRHEMALLATEGIDVRFSSDGVHEIARIAHEINQTIENIGARRLQTVVQKVTDTLSYATQDYKGKTIVIDGEFVRKQLEEFMQQADLRKYVW